MADYKRMVSYMYQYENGIKRKNVGYARVEAKNGQCKITLHMQLLGQLDSIFPTYLIQRDKDGLELIYLGDAILKNQVMDNRFSADENNVMNTGHKLSEFGGLLLFMHDNIFFATEWDDKPIVANEVLDALKPQKKEADDKKTEEKVDPDLSAADIRSIDQAAEEMEVRSPEGFTLAEELNMPKYRLPRGWKTIERLQKKMSVEADIGREFGQKLPFEYQPEPMTEYQPEPAIEFQTEASQDPLQEDLSEMYLEAAQESLQDPQDETAELRPESLAPEKQEEELSDHPTAEHFFNEYPRIYPFEDNEIILCVKIEPKDIGMLPKDLWALSNNSFLMHGFYCYHHLIFAKMKDRCGHRYILGIPGIFHNRERFMARMFGFESFKSIRNRDLQQGDFGYWYIDVKF